MQPTRAIAVLRDLRVEAGLAIAARCWEQGFGLVEASVSSVGGWDLLEALVATHPEQPVGVGTITTLKQAKEAIKMGARAIVAPNLVAEIARYSRRNDIPYLPGVMTPSEIASAQALGIGTCKIFPAGPLSPNYLRNLHGPFPEMRFVAVGGIGVGNFEEFLNAGAYGIGFGGSLESILDSWDRIGPLLSVE